MKTDREEKLLQALNDVGDDLVTGAGNYQASAGGWKRWGAAAASLALVISLSVLALPYLPMGCGSADKVEHNSTPPETSDWLDNSLTGDSAEDCDQPMEEPDASSSPDSSEPSDDTVTDAVAAMDMHYLTEIVAKPLIRWQVGSFASASDLSEDALERLYLAVMERDEPWRDPAAASAGEIRKVLAKTLEGIHIYAPLNKDLPLDGALQELPEIVSEHLYVTGQTVTLTVRVDGHPMTITILLDGDDWRYVSVD